jgi:hypothetical protein
MKTIVLIAAALMLTTGVAEAKTKVVANPPTAEQLAAFYATCIKIAPEASVLCKCKQEAAPKLIDTAFMDIVIASMKGKPLDAKYYDQYNDYIARSNQICKPDYM